MVMRAGDDDALSPFREQRMQRLGKRRGDRSSVGRGDPEHSRRRQGVSQAEEKA